MNPSRLDIIREQLEQAFHPNELKIIDDSHKHIGHPGATSGGGHYKVIIRAKAFENTSPIERHRMIYEALADLMHQEIHALSIDAKP